MFGSIVVGTDGSDTAKEAVRQAVELAQSLGSELLLVSAYQPVSRISMDREAARVPEDVQWMVSAREDVATILAQAQALPARVGAQPGEPPRAVLGPDHQDDVAAPRVATG